jgi:hypothetical protein
MFSDTGITGTAPPDPVILDDLARQLIEQPENGVLPRRPQTRQSGNGNERYTSQDVRPDANEMGRRTPDLQSDERHEGRRGAEDRGREPRREPDQAQARAGDDIVQAQWQGQTKQCPQ